MHVFSEVLSVDIKIEKFKFMFYIWYVSTIYRTVFRGHIGPESRTFHQKSVSNNQRADKNISFTAQQKNVQNFVEFLISYLKTCKFFLQQFSNHPPLLIQYKFKVCVRNLKPTVLESSTATLCEFSFIFMLSKKLQQKEILVVYCFYIYLFVLFPFLIIF